MATVSRIRQVELVGRKIRQLRKQGKLTQTELARRIGVQQSDLSRMEQGEYRVSLDVLFRILAEFKLGIGDFFADLSRSPQGSNETAQGMHQGRASGSAPVAERAARIASDIDALDPQVQQEIEDFIAFKRAQAEVATRRKSSC